jgi:hypothetical protein
MKEEVFAENIHENSKFRGRGWKIGHKTMRELFFGNGAIFRRPFGTGPPSSRPGIEMLVITHIFLDLF